MQKKKILHLITRLDRGGSSDNTLLTIIGLQGNKFDITLAYGVTREFPYRLMREAREKSVRFIFLPWLVRGISPLRDFRTLLRLFSLIKNEGFDIVHTHTSKAGILGRLAAKLAGVPIIVHTPHGHIFYGYCNFFLTKIFVVLERFVAKFTDRIITLTEKGVEEHVKFGIGPPEKFIAIHSGIRFNSFLPEHIDTKTKKREMGISEDSLLIGTVGRLVPVKGHKYLIEAISHLKNKIPNIILLIMGNGYLKKDLENQAKRLNINDKVKFLGFREDIPEILSTLDLFILPSLNEGMGRVLVEAMALGIPVIATEVGGIPDVVINGETGILVQPKNPVALAEAMFKILRDQSLAKRMGERGKKRVISEFDAREMVNKIEKLYRELTKTKKDI